MTTVENNGKSADQLPVTLQERLLEEFSDLVVAVSELVEKVDNFRERILVLGADIKSQKVTKRPPPATTDSDRPSCDHCSEKPALIIRSGKYGLFWSCPKWTRDHPKVLVKNVDGSRRHPTDEEFDKWGYQK